MPRYAVIENGIVDNIIVADYITDPNIVNIDLFPVHIGDTFENGIFKRNGLTIQKMPTLEEKIVALGQEKLNLQIALAEAIEKQETDKLNNQLAVAELTELLTQKGVL